MACTDPSRGSVLYLGVPSASGPASPASQPAEVPAPAVPLPSRPLSPGALEYPRPRSSAGEFRASGSRRELPSRRPFAVRGFVFQPQLPLMLRDLRQWDGKAASRGVSPPRPVPQDPGAGGGAMGTIHLGVPGAAHAGTCSLGPRSGVRLRQNLSTGRRRLWFSPYLQRDPIQKGQL